MFGRHFSCAKYIMSHLMIEMLSENDENIMHFEQTNSVFAAKWLMKFNDRDNIYLTNSERFWGTCCFCLLYTHSFIISTTSSIIKHLYI